MESIFEELDSLKLIIKGISEQFGENCEVVLHDLTNDYEHTIAAIENGHITGREVGGCGSNLGLEVLRGGTDSGNRYGYITQTMQGKVLRSTTIYLRNKAEKVIGTICINFDITNLLLLSKEVNSFTRINNSEERVDELFSDNIYDLADQMMIQALQSVSKKRDELVKSDKLKIISHLEKKGFFLITKSGDRLCDFLNISKYTLYNYLDEAKKNRPQSESGNKPV